MNTDDMLCHSDLLHDRRPDNGHCLRCSLHFRRVFKNGDQMLTDLPLATTIVASNEIPLDASAGALTDRSVPQIEHSQVF